MNQITHKKFPYVLKHFHGKGSRVVAFFDTPRDYLELVEAGIIKPINDLDSGVYVMTEVRGKGRKGALVWKHPQETPSKAKRRVGKKLLEQGGIKFWTVDRNAVLGKKEEPKH